MEAVVVAMVLLMWQWTKASQLVITGVVAGVSTAARFSAVVLAIIAGALVLNALVFLMLPGSVISQGWSRETLQGTQHFTALITVAVGVVAIMQSHARLRTDPSAARVKTRRIK